MCTGVKLMQGSSAAATGAERYKLAISDGRYWCTAMMATQLNELAKTNQIHNNTIMRLDDYLSNAVQGKKYAIQRDTACCACLTDICFQPMLLMHWQFGFGSLLQ